MIDIFREIFYNKKSVFFEKYGDDMAELPKAIVPIQEQEENN